MSTFFASDQSFLDPQISKNGEPYAPKRLKELVQECWFISDQLHTSYTDILDISFTERLYLIEFINKIENDTQQAIDRKLAATKNKK